MSTAVQSLVEQIRGARAAGSPLRIAGGGTWMNAGAPCDATTRLAIAPLRGLVEYEPGDLTLTARAGTSLAELDAVTAAHGQWVALDPFGERDGTLGATIATGSSGPLALGFGTPRDQLLGCEFVTGAGDVVQAGGRVVKNVAGFDLVRLMTGAWGTLGVLTEITVRLGARPEVDTTVAIAVDTRDGVEAARRWLRASEFSPAAAELLSRRAAQRVTATPAMTGTTLLLRYCGNPRLVRAALDAARTIGEPVMIDTSVWSALALSDGPASATVRLSTSPSRVTALWSAAVAVAEAAAGHAHASLARGVVRCVLPFTDTSAGEVARLRAAFDLLPAATRIVERTPPALWRAVSRCAVDDALSAGVRRAFDPDRLLNRGILGDGT